MRNTPACRASLHGGQALRIGDARGAISDSGTVSPWVRGRSSAKPPERSPRWAIRQPRARAIVTATALLWALGQTTASRADLLNLKVVPSNVNATVPPGATGTFELELVNPASNLQSFNVEGFQFELSVPAGSGVLFTDATTATSPTTYIFAGNSFADSNLGGSLILSPPPPPATNDLLGFDTVLVGNTFTTLSPGDTYGLGLILFSVDASASPGIVPITIIPFDTDHHPLGTQIIDSMDHAIPFLASDGQITIQGGAPMVPEPPTSVLALLGVAGLIMIRLISWRA